jgi:hypothetical protein
MPSIAEDSCDKPSGKAKSGCSFGSVIMVTNDYKPRDEELQIVLTQ